MELFDKVLTPGVLWIVFVLIGAFVTIITVTLSYHWREYSVDARKSVRFFRAYVVVLAVLLGTMAISIYLYDS
ncbi:MAG: hypothetical protein NUV96_00185 [Candidatus Colwellbacteria bacterium]|nr:hypothetical protein [Candidatus Colwellbacteria bacterium]